MFPGLKRQGLQGWHRPAVGAQIYTGALMVNMVAKVSQANEPIDKVIKWAEGELEGYTRS